MKVGFGKTSLRGINLFGGRINPQEGKLLYSQMGMLFEAKKHHLEIGLGIARYDYGYWESDGILPSATVGWRIQEP